MSSNSSRTMFRRLLVIATGMAVFTALAAPAIARDRPHGSATLNAFFKIGRPSAGTFDNEGSGISGAKLSKAQINRFTCQSAGDPTTWVDVSCDTTELGQNYAPDNEIAVAVDPNHADHVLVGSNDYFYRFNNSTGARQAIVVTGFFTSFDGGATWLDGQVPVRSGNGAGDPAPAFVGKLGEGKPADEAVALMAQLENTGGQGGCCVSQGDVAVSRSIDGGQSWSPPITVMKGQGAGIGPANQATFWDKEWLTVDNYPSSPFYGRAYVTSTRFLNAIQGSYAESSIYLSYSDDGGLTWSEPAEISGSHPSCSYQETGPAGSTECDENQFSYPEVAPDGALYVHFHNYQNEAEWEQPFDFDAQIMVVKSTDGGVTFADPVLVVQLEDGGTDTPYSVINRQTIWGHQIRWTSAGNISVNPTDADDVTIVFADRGTPNAAAPAPVGGVPCYADGALVSAARLAGTYDPCNAGPGSDNDVYVVRSTDGGASWGPRAILEDTDGHAWFPWADHQSDGTLAVAWDQDDTPGAADTFHHVLKVGAGASAAVGPTEQPDISLTHWAGQYRPQSQWPTVCGPAGYSDPPVNDAEGKDCNAFHGDYTGLAVGPDDSIHVTWTGLNVLETSPQLDFYTGEAHDGYRQDAMYARR
jgi:hypothetical protein